MKRVRDAGPSPGPIRLTGGEWAGTGLFSPPGRVARPALAKVRAAIFTVLSGLEGVAVLDLYAGTGALGFEALSRGARFCLFVETDEAAFRRLDATRPRTAAEWRALRDAWRAFAAARPGGPRADEARVREVESLHQAWRAGGEAADEAAFRTAARDYLARPDAAQRERVERLLP